MGKKHDKPLHLDMPFDEALGRFTQTDPTEVEREKRKQKLKAVPLRNHPADGSNAPGHKSDIKI